MPQPPQQPAMRAPSMTERVTGGLQSAYDVLSENPLVGLIRKLGILPDTLNPPSPADPTNIADTGNWGMGMMPGMPGAGPAFGALRGAGGRTAPIAGNTIDDILANTPAATMRAADTMQVIEPGTGAVLNPARDQAIAYARKLAGK